MKEWKLNKPAILLMILLVPTKAMAQSGDGYDLTWHTIDGGGFMWSQGDGYELGGTIGQPDVGMSTAEGYTLTGGFWAGIVEHGEAPPCSEYDLNQDGFIDLDDINLVLYNSIFVNELYNPLYDLIPDGIVDIADIFEVAVHFGEICPA